MYAIIKTGGKDLAVQLEERGYDWVLEEAGISVAKGAGL